MMEMIVVFLLFLCFHSPSQAHAETVTDIRSHYQRLSSCDNDLLELVSEPFANQLSDQSQELAKTGEDLVCRYEQWKEAQKMWMEVTETQAFVHSTLESANSHFTGHLLAVPGLKESIQVSIGVLSFYQSLACFRAFLFVC